MKTQEQRTYVIGLGEILEAQGVDYERELLVETIKFQVDAENATLVVVGDVNPTPKPKPTEVTEAPKKKTGLVEGALKGLTSLKGKKKKEE